MSPPWANRAEATVVIGKCAGDGVRPAGPLGSLIDHAIVSPSSRRATFRGVTDERVCVYVGWGWGLVPGFGDTVLRYAEYLACHPATGPILEKSQAVSAGLTRTRSLLRHVAAGEIGTCLAQV